MIKRRRIPVFIFALVCAVCILAWYNQPSPEQTLLMRAVKVVGVQANQDIHPYGWLSDHELLLFRYLPNGFWSLGRDDLTTRSESPLTALSVLYRRTGGEENGFPPRISPDGKHFLWGNRHGQFFCADLAGKSLSCWKNYPVASFGPYWQDNGNWAFLKTKARGSQVTDIITHAVAAPNMDRSLHFSPPLQHASDSEFVFTSQQQLWLPIYFFSQSTPVVVKEFI